MNLGQGMWVVIPFQAPISKAPRIPRLFPLCILGNGRSHLPCKTRSGTLTVNYIVSHARESLWADSAPAVYLLCTIRALLMVVCSNSPPSLVTAIEWPLPADLAAESLRLRVILYHCHWLPAVPCHGPGCSITFQALVLINICHGSGPTAYVSALSSVHHLSPSLCTLLCVSYYQLSL